MESLDFSGNPPADCGKDGRKTLFILDSYGLIYREYFAFVKRPLTNRAGENISAVHGFFNNLALTLKNFRPDMFVVALDSRVPTFRHEMYPEYKANRQETPDDLKAQFPWIEEIMAALGITAVRSDGFEADDVIATVARRASAEGFRVFVLSGDKDLLQLVGGNVGILRPGKKDKTKMWEEVDSALVEEEWGVPPEKICDILSLTGDTADNVPGVKGVGGKTAVKFIKEYGSVEALYEHSSEIKGAVGEKVRADEENAFFSKKLVALRYDVPLGDGFSFESLSVASLDYSAAAKKLREFSLPKAAGLFDELSRGKEGESEAVPLKKNEGDYKIVRDKDELSALFSRAIGKGVVAFDTETDSLDTWSANIVGFSFSFEAGSGFYVPLMGGGAMQKNDAFACLEKLFSSGATIVMHNAKFDIEVLAANGFSGGACVAGRNSRAKADDDGQLDLFACLDDGDSSGGADDGEIVFPPCGSVFDTMIAAWVLEPGRSEKNSFSLESLSEKILSLKGTEFSEIVDRGKTFADVPVEVAAQYSAEDSDFTLQLYSVLSGRLSEAGLSGVFATEMRILPILAGMEAAGVHLDTGALGTYREELSRALSEIRREIFDAAGHSFNIASPKQLGVVLFEEMGLKGKRKTKSGGYSTDEESLMELVDNPFVAKILDYRGKSKLLSTYVEALPNLVDSSSRIHTNFMQTGTATGRLSSRDPNLQNIPVREEEGRRIRNAFTAASGKVLISADYSQIELVVLAHLSGDENLCRAFNEGVDVHKSTASLIYGVPIGEVTAEMRRSAKTFNFGIMYGMGAYRLARDLGIGFHEADEFIKAYFGIYSGVREFLEKTVRDAESTGFTSTISGRRREIRDIASSNKTVREAAVRMAKNSPIQGSAADIVKKAMIDIDDALSENPTGARLILQVHDELIFECDDDEKSISDTVALVRDKMEHAYRLSVPLRVSVEVGKKWGEFH